MREAPSITIIRELTELGATFRVFDPEAMEAAKEPLADFSDSVEFCKNNYSALDGADALLIATEWNEFRRPDFERMKAAMTGDVIFDGRNIYSGERMNERGFAYYSIGRAPTGV